MDDPSAAPASADLLLEHGAFVRALARDLCRDDATADDVAQDAMLAALRRPPDTARPLIPWFAAVTRNLARRRRRTDGRRAAREELVGTAAAARTTPSADTASERLDVHRVLVEEVAALDEPFRGTVILRYFDGLATAEIAARHACPEATVRSRLKRAHDRLRERLDERSGGRRDEWLAALLPLAADEARQIAPRWGLRAAVAAGLVAAAALIALLLTPPIASVAPHVAPPPDEAAVPAEPRVREAPPAEPHRDRGRTARAEPPPPLPEPPAVTPRTLRGRVVGPGGTPVEGATVTAHPAAAADPAGSQTPATSVPTGADGAFELPGAPPSELRIAATREGLLGADAVVPAGTADVADLVLTLATGTVLRGQVTAADGGPLDGCEVVIERATSGTQRFRPAEGAGPAMGNLVWVEAGVVKPDAGGAWRTTIPWDRGAFRVGARATGRIPPPQRTVKLTAERREEVVDLVFPRAGELTGVVVAKATGAPVAGAKVTASVLEGLPMGYAGERRPAATASATTADDGTFRFPSLTAGRYAVAAEREGFAAGWSAGRAPGTVRIELPTVEETTISGRVRLPDGTGVARIEVVAMAELELHSFRLRTMTGADGTFVLRDVAPGSYGLRASNGRDGTANALPGTAGPVRAGAHDVEIVVQPSLEMRGRVVDEDGNPVPLAPVNAMSQSGEASPGGFQTADGEGRFTIRGLGAGDYEMVVHPPLRFDGDFTVAHLPGQRAGAGEVVVVLRRGLSINGRVVGPDGAPLARGSVRAMPTGAGANPEPVFWRSGRIGKDGAFVIQGLDPGTYRLALFGFDSKLAPAGAVQGPTRPPSLVLRGGDAIDAGARDVVLHADEGLHIRARVVDGDRPVKGAQCWVVAEGSKDIVMLYSGDDGTFDVFGLDPGVGYRVEAYLAGFRPAKLAGVRAGGDVVLLRLERGRTATGRLLDADGEPIAGARMELVPATLDPGLRPWDHMSKMRHAESGADGTFEAGSLDEPEYRVRVGLWVPGTNDVRWVVLRGTLRPGDRDVVLRM